VEEVYAPLQPQTLPTATLAAAAAAEIPALLPLPTPEPMAITSHPIDAARQECPVCHAVFSMIAPAPFDHADWSNDQCQTCHEVAQEVAQQ